jgi:hypothetical protein
VWLGALGKWSNNTRRDVQKKTRKRRNGEKTKARVFFFLVRCLWRSGACASTSCQVEKVLIFRSNLYECALGGE